MQIQSISNLSNQKQYSNPNFRSVYPIYHWLADGSQGSYAPVMTRELSKFLGQKMSRYLNANLMTKARDVENKLREKGVQASMQEIF